MAFRWICNSCGELHGSNPSRCRNCGGSIFTPATREEISKHSNRPTEVESLAPDKIITYGSTPTPEYSSSPDVAPDGSIGSPETVTPADEQSILARRRGFSAFLIIGAVLVLVLLLLVILLSL